MASSRLARLPLVFVGVAVLFAAPAAGQGDCQASQLTGCTKAILDALCKDPTTGDSVEPCDKDVILDGGTFPIDQDGSLGTIVRRDVKITNWKADISLSNVCARSVTITDFEKGLKLTKNCVPGDLGALGGDDKNGVIKIMGGINSGERITVLRNDSPVAIFEKNKQEIDAQRNTHLGDICKTPTGEKAECTTNPEAPKRVYNVEFVGNFNEVEAEKGVQPRELG
ncbi:unnamed protein product [Vitrella brassicaformis CCMP3155]|uniref:Pectate lyase n=1 Tax=Vitrella brassicaformis (strain CCMP3155) TaxID=1169540 RepID=A0A0G4FQ99_VITBC|nr:unnamed protein product [Vitrella brassicaformis CCMP3155]|eukprot:CEM16614.1 unnamed protein product [Vitrella brassicaformis CCMP3155]